MKEGGEKVNKAVLEMEFRDAGFRSFKMNLDEPREELTGQEIKTVMDDIVDKDIFKTTNGQLKEVVGARVITTTVSDFEM